MDSGTETNVAIKDAEDFGARPYEIEKRLFTPSLGDARQWKPEQQPGGKVVFEEDALRVHDKKGCTIWLREKLRAPILIEYEATVASSGRVSDLNCFWMASDNGKFPGAASGEILPIQ